MSQPSTPTTTATQPQSVREIALTLPENHSTVIHHNGRAIVVFSRRRPLRNAYAQLVNTALNFR